MVVHHTHSQSFTIDELTRGLKNNRITMSIKSNNFMQGCNRDVLDDGQIFKQMSNPFVAMGTTRKNETSNAVQKAVIQQDESVKSNGNTMLQIFLHLLEPKTTLIKREDIDIQLKSFKESLAKELDSEKQLFKKFGFSRKRTCDIDDFKKKLTQIITDTVPFDNDVLTYLSKLSKRDVVVFDVKNQIRIASVCGQSDATVLLISYDALMHKYNMINEFVSKDECNKACARLYFDNYKPNLESLKVLELKALAKLLGCKSTSKQEAYESIKRLLDSLCV